MASAGLIIVGIILIILAIVLFFIFNPFKSSTTVAPPIPGGTVPTCGNENYQTQSPLVCDFSTGTELKSRRPDVTNTACLPFRRVANTACQCGTICETKTSCDGSTLNTTYTVGIDKPCNPQCLNTSNPGDPSCVSDCDQKCNYELSPSCSESENKRQPVTTTNKPNQTCPVNCQVTSIVNNFCAPTVCDITLCNPRLQRAKSNPNGSRECVSGPVCSGVYTIQPTYVITTQRKGEAGKYLARVFTDGSAANNGSNPPGQALRFATSATSTDNQWIYIAADLRMYLYSTFNLPQEEKLVIAQLADGNTVLTSYVASNSNQVFYLCTGTDTPLPGCFSTNLGGSALALQNVNGNNIGALVSTPLDDLAIVVYPLTNIPADPEDAFWYSFATDAQYSSQGPPPNPVI